MSSYCLKFRKNKVRINSRVSKTNNGKTIILSKSRCKKKTSKWNIK